VLATFTIEDVNVRHAFQVNVGNKVHCLRRSGGIAPDWIEVVFLQVSFFLRAEITLAWTPAACFRSRRLAWLDTICRRWQLRERRSGALGRMRCV